MGDLKGDELKRFVLENNESTLHKSFNKLSIDQTEYNIVTLKYDSYAIMKENGCGTNTRWYLYNSEKKGIVIITESINPDFIMLWFSAKNYIK